jgi:hypothetical protein
VSEEKKATNKSGGKNVCIILRAPAKFPKEAQSEGNSIVTTMHLTSFLISYEVNMDNITSMNPALYPYGNGRRSSLRTPADQADAALAAAQVLASERGFMSRDVPSQRILASSTALNPQLNQQLPVQPNPSLAAFGSNLNPFMGPAAAAPTPLAQFRPDMMSMADTNSALGVRAQAMALLQQQQAAQLQAAEQARLMAQGSHLSSLKDPFDTGMTSLSSRLLSNSAGLGSRFPGIPPALLAQRDQVMDPKELEARLEEAKELKTQKMEQDALTFLGSTTRESKNGLYFDASVLSDPDPNNFSSRRSRGGVTEPFPEKVHRMLTDAEKEGNEDILSFYPHGRSFGIHKQDRFVSEILPRYVKQSQMSSFQRQLNLCKIVPWWFCCCIVFAAYRFISHVCSISPLF